MSRWENNDRSTTSIGGIVVGGAVVITVMVIMILLLVGCNRTEPGYAGVIIDYGQGTLSGEPSVTVAESGRYYFVFFWELKRFVKYPISQQTYVMVRSEKEGKVIGDDSVTCRGHDGIPMHIDSRTWWKAQSKNVGKLYLLRPGVPLTGGGQDDIEDQLVRPSIRNAITDACAKFTYDEVYGAKRLTFGEEVTKLLGQKLGEVYIDLDQFLLGEVHLDPEQSAAIAKVAAAQQAAKEAAYLKEKAENEAAGRVAGAEGDKRVKILQAQADAEAIRVINEQLGNSPYYIAFQYAQKWNGAYPTTVVLSNGQTLPIFASIPLSQTAGTTSPIPIK